MLTDENDCSIDDDDGSQGWLVTSSQLRCRARRPRARTNPDDRCCHSCALDAPSGCTRTRAMPNARKAMGRTTRRCPARRNAPNLRCFDQKRRFGMDLLYPTQRYVDALSKPTVPNRAGKLVQNPIFAAPAGMAARSRRLVLLTGIVGVPWQDVASEESLTGAGLHYLAASDLEAQGRFQLTARRRERAG